MYCRITGKSRGFAKPNYFPMLPPISPADAKRFCRVTGKSYGLPSHHYIPVVLSTFSKKKRCKVTSMETGPHHYMPDILYGKRKHIILTDYRYVIPVLDFDSETQKELYEIFQTKVTENSVNKFVYKVEEKRINLVFPAKLEFAVRDGDVRDIMFAKDSEHIMLRLRDGANVSLDLKDYGESLEELLEGEGPKEEVLLEIEREEAMDKKKRKISKSRRDISNMKKIFEIKDEQGKDDDEDVKASKKKKINLPKSAPKNVSKKDVKKVIKILEQAVEDKDSFQDLVKPLIESWDWNTFEKEAKKIANVEPVISKKIKVQEIKPQTIKAYSQDVEKRKLENTTGLETIPFVGCYKPPEMKPLIEKFVSANPENFKKIENLVEKFTELGFETNYLLPTEDELFEVMQNFSKGNKSELSGIPGYSIDIEDRKVFVPGDFILNDEGVEVFVPGGTIKNEDGKMVFVPGLAVSGTKGPSFIPGLIMQTKENKLHFQAGQIIDDEFKAGQTIFINNEPKFIDGQTLVTPEGLRFCAGLVNKQNVFVPGQILSTPDGEKFIAGQTTEIFVAGQNVQVSEDEWVFMAGQTVFDEVTGEDKFVPGRTVITAEGSKFIPGQYINDVFVPGITKEVKVPGLNKTELKFIPGIQLDTKEGTKFVEGQMVKTEHGEIFMPGTIEYGKTGKAKFHAAKNIGEVALHDAPTCDFMVIDSHSLEVRDPNLSVFGNMVQTDDGIEFFPEKIGETGYPHGAMKVIPGKLIKQGNGLHAETKFVPGINTEEGFIPGQVVKTANGEEFVPGQVCETPTGCKFIPGQIIETKTGEMKFVPGQTINNRFVPGQIIDTKSGPTFIPGQVIFTEEEGERFVPGQVVDTEWGARFVPGRIVETDDKVTFIPGAIVETPEGPRFIAPDMKESEGEDFEFSLQSFLVTPEELSLIKPQNWNASDIQPGQFSIDEVMLRQLSAAGMSIGRQIESDDIDFKLQSTIDKEIVEKFCDSHAMSYDVADTLFQMIKTLTEEHKGKLNADNLSEKILQMCLPQAQQGNKGLLGVKSAQQNQMKRPKRRGGAASVDFEAAAQSGVEETNDMINILTKVMLEILKNDDNASNDGDRTSPTRKRNKSESIYDIIANVLNDSVENINIQQLQHTMLSANKKEKLLDQLKNTISKVEVFCKIEEMKQNLMNPSANFANGDVSISTIPNQIQIFVNDDVVNSKSEMTEQLCHFIEDADISSAFNVMSKNNPDMLLSVLNAIQSSNDPNVSVTDTIQQAIIKAVNKANKESVNEILETTDKKQIEGILSETLALAKVLGLNSEAMQLLKAIDNIKKPGKVELNDAAKCLIGRVNIIKQLVEENPEYKQAYEILQKSPTRAGKDEKLRELVRRSGVISVEPITNEQLETSRDIPMSLLADDNILAMEEFMLRRGKKGKAFLILKDNIQCVVPREKSHDVLTGKCAYTVLDENGIREFEPLHVMSALKMTANPHHRFSIYGTDFNVGEEDLLNLQRRFSQNVQRRLSQSLQSIQQIPKDIQYQQCEMLENGYENGHHEEEEDQYIPDPKDPTKKIKLPKKIKGRHGFVICQEEGVDPYHLEPNPGDAIRKRRQQAAKNKQTPPETKVYRQYQKINNNIYLMHAFVFHSKTAKDLAKSKNM